MLATAENNAIERLARSLRLKAIHTCLRALDGFRGCWEEEQKAPMMLPIKLDRFAAPFASALLYSQRLANMIVGVDVGYKYKARKRTSELALRFHVRAKVPESLLSHDAVIPRVIGDMFTDVIEANYIPNSQSRLTRCDPIRPGVSVSRSNTTHGTIGAIVKDNETGRLALLSNWHVLVANETTTGDIHIVQPSAVDGGTAPIDTVATVLRSLISDDGDAAIAILNDERSVDFKMFDTGVVLKGCRLPSPNEVLEKSSRSTGVSRAVIDGMGRYKIPYSIGDVEIDGFRLIPVDLDNHENIEISRSGDSGAIWYDPDSWEGIGLHIAGESDPDPTKESAIACYLERVLEVLDVSLAQQS